MDSHKVEDKEVWEALSNLELFSGKYVKPGDPDETSLPPEQSNFTPSVSKLLSFIQLEFRPEDSIHFKKGGVSAASVEAEPCVVDIESSNNKRWSSSNFPWAKELEEFGKKLYVNFSLKPEQREVINATMSGRDVFAEISPIDGGDVTYELPALLRLGTTVVVVPLPHIVALRVEHPVMGTKSMGLFGSMARTEKQRILEELATDSCEFKLLYVTADTITESEPLLKHLKTLYDGGLLARIVIEEVQSVSERYKIPDYQGLGIFKREFPSVPLVALASIATDSVRDEVVNILGLVNYIHVKKRVSSSKQSKRGKCGPTSPKRSLTIVKQNSFGSESPDHNIVDEDLCPDSHVGVESMDLRVVAPSWGIEKSKIGRRQRRQTKLSEELCLLNSIYGENFLLDFNSGIDISIPLRVLLSKDLLKDESTILKINWTEKQVGIHIEPRDGVNDPLAFYEKLQSVAEQKHIKGSIKALLNAVRETFNFGEIPIMVGHIIYPKYDREYTEIKKLGKGSFGSVFECKVKLDDMSCAIKKIRFAGSEKEVRRVINEVKMLSCAQHPNVVGYHQAWIEDYQEPKNLCSYDDDDASSFGPREKMMYIHMELCEESLESKLAKEKKLPRHVARSYFRQILEALQYIHGKDLIHRDLKMDNIFIDDSGTVKIGDFGLAMRKDVSSTTNSSPVGAYLYRAPEMKKGKRTTNKVDMYALGLILFQLFCPRGCSVTAIEMLKKPALRGQVFKLHKVDETAKPLILELLQTDPLKRPSAADLLRRLDGLEVTRKNTQETEIQQIAEQEHIQIESQSSLMIKVHTHQDKRQKTVGIGITATDSNGQLQAGWALRERMSADPLQDKAVAVKLALQNAIKQGWRNIKVELDDRELVKRIKETRNSNQLMATLIHDIQSISNSFHKCSFSFANSGYVGSIKLTLHALNIFLDKE